MAGVERCGHLSRGSGADSANRLLFLRHTSFDKIQPCTPIVCCDIYHPVAQPGVKIHIRMRKKRSRMMLFSTFFKTVQRLQAINPFDESLRRKTHSSKLGPWNSSLATLGSPQDTTASLILWSRKATRWEIR